MQNIYPDLMITMISGNNKKKREERYCFDSADPIISTVKSAGSDFGHDG